MSKYVPFLTRDRIETESETLLAGYGGKFGLLTGPPIPVDEILNTYLRVTLDFDNLSAMFGVSTDVFGATWIEREQVIIDEGLDPTDHPERVGRYNFTVAHETGHWQLHRPYLLSNPNQQLLFDPETAPTIVCRTSDAKEPIEWQADTFAACLLMPKRMLKAVWRSKHAFERITLGEIRTKFRIGNDDNVIEVFAKDLARAFAVSPVAMRIRLEGLGMVVREEVPALFRA